MKLGKMISLSVAGFRNLKQVSEVAMPDLAVLIGGNGVGKSTVIRFVDFLKQMQQGRLQRYVMENGGGDDQLFMGSNQTSSITAQLKFDLGNGSFAEYVFELGYRSVGDGLCVEREGWRRAGETDKEANLWNFVSDGDRGTGKESALAIQSDETARLIHRFLADMAVYQFHNTSVNAAINKYWDVTDCYRLRSDGGNLASVLLDLKKNDPRRYSIIVRQIQRFVPTLEDFELNPVEASGKVMLKWRSRFSDKTFGAHLTSDGSLRLFCLITLLSLPEERLPSVICIDEPELGLHPSAVELVAEMVKIVARKRQVILATQSPYLVDCFELENVIIAESRGGATSLKNLPRSEYQRWLDADFQLSDIWLSRSVGSKA